MKNGYNLIDCFQRIVSEIQMKGKNSMRTITYCQTILQGSKLFESKLGNDMYLLRDGKHEERLIETMHFQAAQNVKGHVLLPFSHRNGYLRVLIATIAFGIGVNCQGVQRVIIHFGPPKTVKGYIQEGGRCGREGEKNNNN